MRIDRTSGPRLIRFAGLAALGTIALIVGLLSDLPGMEPGARTLLGLIRVAGWLLLGAAALMVVQDVAGNTRSWFHDHFPDEERQEEIAAEARRLGLELVAREDSSVDLPTAFADDIRSWDRVFAGSWRGLDVRVFDCSRAIRDWTGEETQERLTCAVLPLDAASPQVEIVRETVISRNRTAAEWRELNIRDEAFDRAFLTFADREGEARRLLDPRVRSRLLADAPDRALIHFWEQRLLYCCARLPIEERAGLLDIATRLRSALPQR